MATPKAPDLSHIAAPLRGLAVPLKGLKLDPANARKHGKRNLEAIAASLKRFGQRLPLVIQKQGRIVRVGNGRVEAARALGWTHMAAFVVDENDAEATAYAIADNRTADLAQWDDEALAQLLAGLPADLQEAAGFSEKELARALHGLGAGVVEDQAPQPAKNAVSKRGDLWLLGPHRLLNGSSTEPKDVQRLMGEERARLFATDPPYLVGYDGTNHNGVSGGKSKIDWSDRYGCENWDDADANPDLYDNFIAAAKAHAILEDAAWYCWHASRNQVMLENTWTKHGAFAHQQIIWVKSRPVLTRSWFLWIHEPCLMGWVRPNKPKRMDGTSVPGVWDFGGQEKALADLTKEELLTLLNRATTIWRLESANHVHKSKEEGMGHPTPKPVECFAIPIRQHTRKGEICYEPFSGSGTQISAAEQLGRRCFAIEIEPVFVDVAIRRWQALTGQDATLEGTGKTWTQTAASRKKPTHAKPKPQATETA